MARAKKSTDDSNGAAKLPVSNDALKDWIRSRGVAYLKDPNITSVGIGYKVTGGKVTDTVAVQFTVGKKAAPEALESLGTEPIPKSVEIDGVEIPTDVIERKYEIEVRIIPQVVGSDRKKRLDPIVPGISVGNANEESAGTIGCIVYDASDGTPYILSNWHVLHGNNGMIGDNIVQPGPYDDNRISRNRLGKLVRSHLGQAGDCAIATIEDRQWNPEIFDLAIRPEELGDPELGDRVIKSGRTTNVTNGKVIRIHTISKIDYGDGAGDREIGGFEIGIDSAHKPSDGEISKGGDSGSVWLVANRNGNATNVMAGLHFAGEVSEDDPEQALACYPKSIFEKLEIALVAPAVAQEPVTLGYSSSFLRDRIELPKLTAAAKRKVFVLDGSEVVPYTHFSLAVNTARDFAFWVAWNVDGSGLLKLSRDGIDFVKDPRVSAEFQAGDELYTGNRLDRGHIARRADLLWGGPVEAEKANTDSFYFTNITPQMDNFNQSMRGGLWGRLEDAIFEDVDVEDLKISVFGGPVFRDDDRTFRKVKIPREFWKVIAFIDAGALKAKGFLLTQSLDQLEALDLNEFKVYQVALTEIEDRTDLRFAANLKTADSFAERLANRPEAAADRPPLEFQSDIDWS